MGATISNIGRRRCRRFALLGLANIGLFACAFGFLVFRPLIVEACIAFLSAYLDRVRMDGAFIVTVA
jgi:hypothetical protein